MMHVSYCSSLRKQLAGFLLGLNFEEAGIMKGECGHLVYYQVNWPATGFLTAGGVKRDGQVHFEAMYRASNLAR